MLRVFYINLRGVKYTMDEQKPQIKWVLQITTLLATLNTAAIAFGFYHLDNAQLQLANELVSVVGAIVGNIITHRK